MCMEDKKIARETAGFASIKTATNGVPVLLISADAKRTFISFHNGSINNAVILPKILKTVTTTGMACRATVAPLEFSVEDYGLLVTDEWWGYGDGADAVVLITVATLQREK